MTDPHSNSTSGYHLFLEPSGRKREVLQDLIQQLAKKFDGPAFTAHVTLLSGISIENEEELMQKTAQLAADQSSFELSLDGLGMEDRYFRALYLRARENEALTSLHEEATELFSIQNDEPYIPHLSLLYGNYPEAKKLDALDTIYIPEVISFTVDTISLYKTEGKPKDWVKIQEFPLVK